MNKTATDAHRTTLQAISIKQVCVKDYPLKVPNATTQKTWEAADSGEDIVVCKNAEDTFEKLGI